MSAKIRASDVTVVTPTIPGREHLLERALTSVHAQQVTVGDVIVLRDDQRRGATWARNTAIEQVKTNWIAWLDDDDVLKPNHVKVLVRGANTSGADLVFSYAEFVGGRDPLAVFYQGRIIPEPINVPWDSECEASLRFFGNFIPITYLVKTEWVRRVGGFPAPNSFGVPASRSGDCEDFGLLLRLLAAGARFHHVCGVRTWEYHFHDENTGGRGAAVA